MDFSVIDYLEFGKGIIDVNSDTNTLPPVKRHYVEQANNLLYGIDKVYFLGEQPAIYFKSVPNFKEEVLEDLAKVQKSIWNQGKAPFLYVESPTEIRVYNGFDKPINPNDDSQNVESLEIFKAKKGDETALNELKDVFGVVSIDSGDFWSKEDYANKIKSKVKIEQALIKNLRDTRTHLKSKGLDIHVIHDILLRVLFTLYLEDRGATDPSFYQNYKRDASSFFHILGDREATYGIFKKLEVSFNGNLCPITDKEKDVTIEHLQIVKECFWSKIKDNKNQLNLFDWRIFDFRIIPIELISGIYEDFLSNEGGEEKQSKTGAFYTPRPLAEFILNKVLPYPTTEDTNHNIKILDPTCGSGIFLVESLNRLLDRWEMANPDKNLNFDTICKIVKDNIFGVEQEKEAIKVAAFSLYLAMLNRLDPKNLWQTGKFPYLIYEPENPNPNTQGNNLFRMSTISSGPFEEIEYDLIVGNPPFKKGGLDEDVSQYLTKHKFAQEAVIAFLHKATTLCPKGKIALVTGIKILFNTGKPYQKFRDFLFEKTYVEEIYNFSILRNASKDEGGSLFGAASGPAGILFYSNTFPENPSNRLLYVAPKTVLKNRFMNGIAIDATDVKYLPREQVKKPDTKILKSAMWGTEKDFALIEQFKSVNSLLNIFKEKKWKDKSGVGFQTSDADKPNFTINLIPHIDAGKINRYYTDIEKTRSINRTIFRRFGNEEAYKKPHVLIKTGQENKKFCSSYLDFDCSFQSTIYGIHIEKGEKELKLLSVFLNSGLASYIMFLTAASWGIEREEVKPNEIFDLPDLCFSLPEDKKEAIVVCMDEIIAIKKQNLAIYSIEEIEKKIDNLFYEALNLTSNEIVLIEDLINLTLDGFQNKKESIAFRPCQNIEIKTYSQYLANNINSFLKFGSSLTAWVTVFPVAPKIPLNIVALHFNQDQEAGYIEENGNTNIAKILKEINEFTYQEYTESIYYRKFVKYYSGDTIYIIKPNEKRFWSRSLALNEADEIIAEILSKKS
ncbi:N-6 DNA methylase [Arcicella sp. LKC2W]|uniref:HsdM family class I SAM-dependent methyltransferase n=1 Tax=Arcicella sp. LKC2W TaxID=2984198 RepID=UPI002B21A2B4|nr:N-6 DNA methylase [Arcicella sp. LKC2W]MEA5457997.1 N-6 DNA methylase [Arcicella sp. LKC2W]